MNPEETNEEQEAPKTQAERLMESITWVVDMMNSGKVNPDDVYPRGRYQGD